MDRDERTPQPLASEMYEDLKRANQFKEWVIRCLFGLNLVLLLALVGTNLYHFYQWSHLRTVVVDSGEGGHANYVQGDNTGGIHIGEPYDDSITPPVRPVE